jgi:hypothetical protein
MPVGQEPLDAENANHYDDERRRYGGCATSTPSTRSMICPSSARCGQRIPRRLTGTPSTWSSTHQNSWAPDAKAADLERALKSVIPSNKYERATLIQILAHAGILQDRDHPGIFDGYVPPDARDLPTTRFADWVTQRSGGAPVTACASTRSISGSRRGEELSPNVDA